MRLLSPAVPGSRPRPWQSQPTHQTSGTPLGAQSLKRWLHKITCLYTITYMKSQDYYHPLFLCPLLWICPCQELHQLWVYLCLAQVQVLLHLSRTGGGGGWCKVIFVSKLVLVLSWSCDITNFFFCQAQPKPQLG